MRTMNRRRQNGLGILDENDQFIPSSAPVQRSSRYASAGKYGQDVDRIKKAILYHVNNMNYVHVLCLSWLLLIYYGERWYPYHAIKKCQWPSFGPDDARIALIADPQLVDANTYPGRNWFFEKITEYIVDVYLRRNWVYMNSILDPDTNFFLGDLFDGGREWGDKQWKKEFVRFTNIFTKPPYRRTVFSLPGNHDIGYGDTVVPHALERFQAYFGPTSSSIDIANHTFVLLDTISMLNTINSTIYDPPKQFMKSIAEEADAKRRILLTHVPLFRSLEDSCGRQRESQKDIPYVRGYQYQTLVDPEITNSILQSLEPMVVFSGDDHDACHVKHPFTNNVGRQAMSEEFTVKSFSMAMGISMPGIQLLTLDSQYSPQSTTPSYKTSICLMPSPYYPFLLYGLFAVVTLVAVYAYDVRPRLLPSKLRAFEKRERTEKGTPLPTSIKESPREQKKIPMIDDIFYIGVTVFVFMWFLGRSIFY